MANSYARSLALALGLLIPWPGLAAPAPARPAPAKAAGTAAASPSTATQPVTEPLSAALPPQAWAQVEKSVDRALKWLSTQQARDGSFDAPDNAQPAATALSVMAFLSRGHVPGEGPYGRHLDRGIDFVLQCQSSEGLLAAAGSDSGSNGKTANYNHAIAGLMLTEVYGMTDRTRAAKLKPAIERAVQFTRRNQTLPKENPGTEGGWRYLYSNRLGDSDLSVTAWQLMFLRSARNAEFDIPKAFIDEAVTYVLNCWEDRQGLFYYQRSGDQVRWSRGMVGAGTLSLAMAGQHGTTIAQRAGDWLLTHPFHGFGDTLGSGDRFFYSTYYCSQAMAQLGGRHWKIFFPNLVNTLLQGQQPSGEWPPEPYGSDSMFGNTYTTAMAVLSLTPPLQLLPVYQR